MIFRNFQQIFSIVDAGRVLVLVKRTKNNTLYILNCGRLTLDDVGPFSMKRNKQLSSNFEGSNLKKFKQFESWGKSQVASKKKWIFVYNVSIEY